MDPSVTVRATPTWSRPMDTDALLRLFFDRLARLEDELDQLRYLAR